MARSLSTTALSSHTSLSPFSSILFSKLTLPSGGVWANRLERLDADRDLDHRWTRHSPTCPRAGLNRSGRA
jgi:hypothetical protein